MCLEGWLDRLLERDPDRIEPGVERLRRIMGDLLKRPPEATVIAVAGTNGKGSSVAMLAAICRAAGYRVGSYTSPHLVDVRERFALDGRSVAAGPLIEAFERIEAHPDSGSLTYFEWLTLAAFLVFAAQGAEVWILEVGLGGRLDAVNALDADLALITAIGLDHRDWLGDDREAIGREKAGILRAGQSAVYVDAAPVASVREHARAIGARLRSSGRDFELMPSDGDAIEIRTPEGRRRHVAPPLRGEHQRRNAAGVIALLAHPDCPLRIPEPAIDAGLQDTVVTGRMETCSRQGRSIVLDVAHNGEAARALAEGLGPDRPGRLLAVFSALADKPVAEMVAPLLDRVDAWWVAGLPLPRAMPGDELRRVLIDAGAGQVHRESGLIPAYNAALGASRPGDEIVIFGSFHVVGPLRQRLYPADNGPQGGEP
jgi:dihydrofolate synthase/folylpolyglutamate synthase